MRFHSLNCDVKFLSAFPDYFGGSILPLGMLPKHFRVVIISMNFSNAFVINPPWQKSRVMFICYSPFKELHSKADGTSTFWNPRARVPRHFPLRRKKAGMGRSTYIHESSLRKRKINFEIHMGLKWLPHETEEVQHTGDNSEVITTRNASSERYSVTSSPKSRPKISFQVNLRNQNTIS